MEKAIRVMPDSVHNRIKNSWQAIRYEKTVDYQLIWRIILVFAVFLLFLLLRYRQISIRRYEMANKNTELRTINQQLEEQKAAAQYVANHDLLTSLPNRSQLLARLQHAIDLAARQGRPVAVLFIDLDRFKFVNDSLGHHIGDELLKRVSQIMTQTVRKADTLARLGGDEFMLVMESFEDRESPAKVARSLIDAIAKPLVIGDHEVQISASIGVAFFPDDSDDTHTLIKYADIAMYQAKEEGKNCFRYYTEDLSAKIDNRLKIENTLRYAISENQFELVYQPVIDLATSRVSSAEALIRWHHPELGTINSETFIPIAEENGFIHELGLWVLNEACQQIRQWQESGLGINSLSINVSSIQFQQRDLTKNFKAILEQAGVSAERINIEITENHLMDQTERNIAFLNELKQMGHTLSVDDFGVGYSSMSYMKRLPLDYIKIDRSFISDIPKNENDVQITKAIVALSQNLGYVSIAEGVESAEQLKFLRDIGCHYAQGFFIAKPLRAELFAKRVKELNDNPSWVV